MLKKIFFYSLYCLCITILFLVILFPEQSIKNYLKARIAASKPGLVFSVERIRPALPLCLKMSDLSLSYSGNPLVHAQRVLVRPQLLSVFNAKKKFNIDTQIASGEIKAAVTLQFASDIADIDTVLSFQGIDIEKLDFLSLLHENHLTGKAEGKLSYNGPLYGGGKGEGRIDFSKAGIRFAQKRFGIAKLDFDNISIEFSINRNMVTLKKVEAKGNMLELKATGTINLNLPFSKSRVDISGTLVPRPSLLKKIGGIFPRRYLEKGGLPFRITGSFEMPHYSVGN